MIDVPVGLGQQWCTRRSLLCALARCWAVDNCLLSPWRTWMMPNSKHCLGLRAGCTWRRKRGEAVPRWVRAALPTFSPASSSLSSLGKGCGDWGLLKMFISVHQFISVLTWGKTGPSECGVEGRNSCCFLSCLLYVGEDQLGNFLVVQDWAAVLLTVLRGRAWQAVKMCKSGFIWPSSLSQGYLLALEKGDSFDKDCTAM